MMAIIRSLKCTVPFSFAVPLFSLAVTRCTTHCHSFSLIFTLCHSLYQLLSLVVTRCYSLSLVVIRCHSLYHSLSFIVTCSTTRCHSLSFVVTRCATRCHSLSLDVPLACLFINDPRNLQKITELHVCIFSIL